MKDPFAPQAALRLKPVDVPGFPAPIDLRRSSGSGRAIPEGVEASLTVGREADNDVALSGGGFPSVSSHHARFELRHGVMWVVDLGSKNGVLVGGHAIDGEQRLELGDQVRLGSVGPKFLVVGGRSLEETVFVKADGMRDSDAREVEKIVERSTRRTLRLAALLGAVVVAAIGFVIWDRNTTREEQETRDLAYEDEIRGAAAQIAALEARERARATEAIDAETRRREEIARLEASLAERTAELEATLEERSRDEQALVARIAGLETTGASRDVLERVERDLEEAREEIDQTREDLTVARRRVDLFDPVNLAQARLSGVGRVRSSVVLIENRVTLLNRKNGITLHLESQGSGAGRTVLPNYSGRGEEFGLESTGSGFCVDAEGWIITNAHVISSPDTELLRDLSRPDAIEQVVELNVVFSGDSTRHPAKVYAVAPGDIDLALVKIEPFEGMPTLEGFQTDTAPPVPGSDIYLFGFPLGHMAVQEGETVIASTFRGILSRNVGGQMQVDAGVHPGNSGGPITDSDGRVVGVVVSVQAGPDRTAVYTIGYGIPIADAATIWPPEVKSVGEKSEAEASPAAGSSAPAGDKPSDR
ncbi:putative periplasmic serine endoprotease DegP-like precursor [Planctomycetes bacterium Poly30]|uniref:Putative periplasmic serine endoprotease DegP-like n=1 Tax=Saltatorellus ferox TaxID=2528018 RepID=A0A518EN29_9BACT|nr:putative periplasmic serine endoprotease DegP-like precursor [Planctomycetes bacterium Poly30]